MDPSARCLAPPASASKPHRATAGGGRTARGAPDRATYNPTSTRAAEGGCARLELPAASTTPPTGKNGKSGAANATAQRFGTFAGVFTPCTLTILGVIMYLRFGQVVGQAGILHALVIVLLAKTITTLTALSLSAISTNTRVKGGGAYFLISRSLGVEYGGAIGVVFYLAQAVSVAMYVIGFSEALVAVLPACGLSVREASTLVNVAVCATCSSGPGGRSRSSTSSWPCSRPRSCRSSAAPSCTSTSTS